MYIAETQVISSTGFFMIQAPAAGSQVMDGGKAGETSREINIVEIFQFAKSPFLVIEAIDKFFFLFLFLSLLHYTILFCTFPFFRCQQRITRGFRRQMVFPILVGIGVTVAALTLKATIETVARCKKLTPYDIAKFNCIEIPKEGNGKIWPKDNIYWRRFNELDNEMEIGGFSERMNRFEAMRILGISSLSELKKDEIRKRHRKMMMQNHPDKGGSKFLAIKINMAKEVLEREFP